jgi:flagellar basal body-associated protein FliL
MQGIMVVFACYIDLLAQYIWGLSFAYAEIHKGGKAFGLRFVYIVYILVFVVLSAIGVFMAEINTIEAEAQATRTASQHIADQYDEYTRQINNLIDQGAKESDTGRGPRAREIDAKITELRTLRDALPSSETVTKSNKTSVTKVRTTFQSLHEVLKLSANFFKVVMFFAAMFMLCLGNMLTPWKVSLKVTKADTNEPATPPVVQPEPDQAQAAPALEDRPAVIRTAAPVSDTEEFVAFASEAIRESRVLNSTPRVSEKTGIPLERCNLYRTLLDNMSIDGQPVITVQAGDSKTYRPSVANFHKEQIIDHIRSNRPGI